MFKSVKNPLIASVVILLAGWGVIFYILLVKGFERNENPVGTFALIFAGSGIAAVIAFIASIKRAMELSRADQPIFSYVIAAVFSFVLGVTSVASFIAGFFSMLLKLVLYAG